MTMINGILVPMDGEPTLVILDNDDIIKSINKILGCEMSDATSLYWLEDHDFEVAVFCDDDAVKKYGKNELASKVAVHELHGACVFVDELGITLSDFEEFKKIAENIDLSYKDEAVERDVIIERDDNDSE
jgi:hypothetical protein